MINLRYHIVSVVAVFLALGIGLALGSTFVDSILVNELEDQVNEFKIDRDAAIDIKDQAVADKKSAEEELEVLRFEWLQEAQIHDAQLERLRRSAGEEVNAIREQSDAERKDNALALNTIETLMPRDRLEGTSWVIVAPTGVDLLAISEIREILAGSDGHYLGTLWIRPSMSFEKSETLMALADLFGVEPSSEEIPGLTVSHIAAWLKDHEEANDEDDQMVNEAINQMRYLGLLRHDRYGSSTTFDPLENLDSRLIFVNDSAHMGLQQELFIPLLKELTDQGQQGMGAMIEIANETSPMGEVVNKIRNEAELAEIWSTFDEIGSVEDRLGLLVGLSRLPVVGHYGSLSTAEERFPK